MRFSFSRENAGKSRFSLPLALAMMVAVTGLLLARNGRAQSSNSTQIIFSATGGTFNYDTPPASGDDAFGFWIWCSGPSSSTPYNGECQGSMYFYGISHTLPVDGTATQVSAGQEQFKITVWTPSSAKEQWACTLTNETQPPQQGPNSTIDVTCSSPGGTATVTGAIVTISR